MKSISFKNQHEHWQISKYAVLQKIDISLIH